MNSLIIATSSKILTEQITVTSSKRLPKLHTQPSPCSEKLYSPPMKPKGTLYTTLATKDNLQLHLV